MSSLGELLQRIARSLEEAREQGPADDLRARLGYGTGDEDEDEDDYEPAEDAFGEPEATRRRPIDREPETGAARTRPIEREPEAIWRPPAARSSAPPAAYSGAPGPRPAPVPEAALQHRRSSPAPVLPSPAAAGAPFHERIRIRLRTPHALREAFVVKEVLDRPLARRRRGPGMR